MNKLHLKIYVTIVLFMEFTLFIINITMKINLLSTIGRKVIIATILTSLFLSSTILNAISIRHDVAESNYFNLAAPYDAVGRLSWSTAIGTATLVSPTKILTAAHNVDNDIDGVLDDTLANYQFLTGTDVDTATNTLSSFASIVINPNWITSTGSAQYDMAVITLSTPFGGITPMSVSIQNPVGQVGITVGYGGNGNGQTFADGLDGLRRAANNQIDFVGTESGAFTAQTDFDSPAGDTNTYGSSVALAFEGTTAGGDSGGPLLADFGSGYSIVGVLNAGFNPTGSGNASEYGDVSIWASILDSDNQNFLTANGITLVPEPATYAIISGIVMLLITAVRRRR